MSEYSFGPAPRPKSRTTSVLGIFDKAKPVLHLSTHSLFIGEPLYELLGSPAYLNIRTDTKKKAFMLLPAVDGKDGYKVRQVNTTGPIPYFMVFSGYSGRKGRPYSGSTQLADLRKLPVGIYKPVGGNIFEYDEAATLKRTKK